MLYATERVFWCSRSSFSVVRSLRHSSWSIAGSEAYSLRVESPEADILALWEILKSDTCNGCAGDAQAAEYISDRGSDCFVVLD